MAEPAVIARNLSKTYRTTVREPGLRNAIRSMVAPRHRDHVAVQDVSFEVAAGELVVLLGPNGAGKSTLIKMLTGILQPTAGSVVVAGIDPARSRIQNAHNVGVVFGQRNQLWWDLPVIQTFQILRDMYGLDESTFRRQLSEFDEMLALSEFWSTRGRHLSLGQRVRADLASALLHDPAVVFLDEPTIGMDVVAKDQVRRFLLNQVADRGRTVLLTTHDMNEVAHLAERVILINHATLVSDGPLADLQSQFGGTWKIRVTLLAPEESTPEIDGLEVVDREGPVIVYCADRSPTAEPMTVQHALALVVQQVAVDGLSVENDDLEDVMRRAFLSHSVAAQHDVSARRRPGQSGE